MFFVLVSAGAMIALAVFLGIQNSKQSVQQSIVDDCNAALTNSPFTDVSVTELRGECVQDNASYLQRTVMWTGIRAGMQVLFFLSPTIPRDVLNPEYTQSSHELVFKLFLISLKLDYLWARLIPGHLFGRRRILGNHSSPHTKQTIPTIRRYPPLHVPRSRNGQIRCQTRGRSICHSAIVPGIPGIPSARASTSSRVSPGLRERVYLRLCRDYGVLGLI